MATITVKKSISAKGVDIRKIAHDYMYKMSQLKWTPSTDIDLTVIKKTLFYKKGETYTGILYTSGFYSANRAVDIESFKIHLDENNNYVDSPDIKNIAGNNCSSSVVNAWKRVVTSVTASYTGNMLPTSKTGILPVGEYKYEPDDETTEEIVKRNSEDVIYNAYAQLKTADAIVTAWKQPKRTGHVRMIKEVNVVKAPSGKIDPEKSTVTTIEQTSSFDSQEKNAKTTWFIDHTYTFSQLYSALYIPVTCAEFRKDEAEDITVKFYGMSPAQTYDGTFTGTVESNYNILAVKAQIKDEQGNVVCDFASYPVKQLFEFAKEDRDSRQQLEKGKKYSYSMKAEFAFGEPVELQAFDFTF